MLPCLAFCFVLKTEFHIVVWASLELARLLPVPIKCCRAVPLHLAYKPYFPGEETGLGTWGMSSGSHSERTRWSTLSNPPSISNLDEKTGAVDRAMGNDGRGKYRKELRHEGREGTEPTCQTPTMALAMRIKRMTKGSTKAVTVSSPSSNQAST